MQNMDRPESLGLVLGFRPEAEKKLSTMRIPVFKDSPPRRKHSLASLMGGAGATTAAQARHLLPLFDEKHRTFDNLYCVFILERSIHRVC